MSEPKFWDDKTKSEAIIKENNEINEIINKVNNINSKILELEEIIELLETETDEELLINSNKDIGKLLEELEKFEVDILLNEEYDDSNVILEITPGAGGTESCDWAEMLHRMYIRWAKDKGYKIEELNFQAGDEAGIKNAAIKIIGSKDKFLFIKLKAIEILDFPLSFCRIFT